jgi:hypothetical protein
VTLLDLYEKLTGSFLNSAYKGAERVLTGSGLSLGSRIVLGLVCAVFGLVLLAAGDGRGSVLYYLPGAFCLLITFACFTAGRVRQFLGSCIGVAIFGLCLWWVIDSVVAWTGEGGFPGKPLTMMMLAGVPGAAYAWRVRFGLRRRQPPARRIAGFHQDGENHWVADLECGHAQHVRHDPPWQNRPWVATEGGRAAAIGQTLNCAHCPKV